jgi:hypothetical protein
VPADTLGLGVLNAPRVRALMREAGAVFFSVPCKMDPARNVITMVALGEDRADKFAAGWLQDVEAAEATAAAKAAAARDEYYENVLERYDALPAEGGRLWLSDLVRDAASWPCTAKLPFRYTYSGQPLAVELARMLVSAKRLDATQGLALRGGPKPAYCICRGPAPSWQPLEGPCANCGLTSSTGPWHNVPPGMTAASSSKRPAWCKPCYAAAYAARVKAASVDDALRLRRDRVTAAAAEAAAAAATAAAGGSVVAPPPAVKRSHDRSFVAEAAATAAAVGGERSKRSRPTAARDTSGGSGGSSSSNGSGAAQGEFAYIGNELAADLLSLRREGDERKSRLRLFAQLLLAVLASRPDRAPASIGDVYNDAGLGRLLSRASYRSASYFKSLNIALDVDAFIYTTRSYTTSDIQINFEKLEGALKRDEVDPRLAGALAKFGFVKKD